MSLWIHLMFRILPMKMNHLYSVQTIPTLILFVDSGIPVQQAQSSDSACYIADVDQHAGAYVRMDWYSGR